MLKFVACLYSICDEMVCVLGEMKREKTISLFLEVVGKTFRGTKKLRLLNSTLPFHNVLFESFAQVFDPSYALQLRILRAHHSMFLHRAKKDTTETESGRKQREKETLPDYVFIQR